MPNTDPNMGPPTAREITVAALTDLLAADVEHAVVDVREEGVFTRDGHLFAAVPVPLSRLELRIGILVPRLATAVVVIDAGDGYLARQAALRLGTLGYSDVAVLAGGLQAWHEAGGELFTGSNVVGKAFGEFVEHHDATPRLSAEELKARLDRGEDIVVLDSRPLPEFETMSIPGAIDAPGAELVFRAHGAVTSPKTAIVVNCAGRTRSIIGAQALINAGVRNPVFSLENGTMAWLLAGYRLDHGQTRSVPPPAGEALAEARASAARLAERFAIARIDSATLLGFEAARERRSLHLLDVRTAQEYEAGHWPGARWAPGGQLVQGIDEWVATRRGRIVLLDDADAVRATITASWLAQIDWGEVSVHAAAPDDPVEAGPERPVLLDPPTAMATIDPAALQTLLQDSAAVVLDVGPSPAYRAGHIPGGWFAIRARLVDRLSLCQSVRLPGSGTLVLTSPDGALAAYAAADLAGRTDRPIRVLAGGTAAWRAAGLPLESGDTLLLDEPEDVWMSPYGGTRSREQAFHEYLDWEIALLAQLEREPSAKFRRFA